ncbi:tetratricopeptide repeat protein [Aquisalimonas lutea]|uniref:tetratricopeptide repeat protein n=1 Tax=Aquisalimonas lutea TaxID=1327750 RepID=UPI0025B49D60|nr:tetratricopeptide repeat protein [Aquisalimonas lutea]MDN3518675.1 tetratricopeptide repeat protein [Aquisalimonas lutea]
MSSAPLSRNTPGSGAVCAGVLAGFLFLLIAGCASNDAAEESERASADVGHGAPAELVRAAEDDEARAQYRLGMMYLSGEGAERDSDAAEHWLRRAARQGHLEAQMELARLYYNGQHVARNPRAAAYWFRQAAEQGEGEAQYALYNMLFQGVGGDIHVRPAMGWAYRAARAGHEGGRQAWRNRNMILPPSVNNEIQRITEQGEWPPFPKFSKDEAERLREGVTGHEAGTDDSRGQGVRVRIRFPDGTEVRIRGVEEMRSALPVDGTTLPWISYEVVEITRVIRQARKHLRGDADVVETSVMTELPLDGDRRLRSVLRSYVSEGARDT